MDAGREEGKPLVESGSRRGRKGGRQGGARGICAYVNAGTTEFNVHSTSVFPNFRDFLPVPM